MFTGIVEELGQVLTIQAHGDDARLRVRGGVILEGARIGESIAVSGVCLTIVATDGDCFEADLAAETLRRTTLGTLRAGDPVNLERAVRLDQRLGGHIVQGHVDGVAIVTAVRPEGAGIWMEFSPPRDLLPYIVEKGSVSVDGVSLTVAKIVPNGFAVALIPHTLDVTTLHRRGVGALVNIEVDILAKYVERLLEGVRAR